MLLNIEITKLAFITQNNYVYEHTAENPTPEMSLNIRSPYRRQKRDFSIIRSSFRRLLYTGIEIPAINTLPSSRSYRLLPTFLPSCDHIDHFLHSYLLTIILTTLPSSRSHRLLLTFLPSCDHTDYQTTHTRSANQNRARFTMPRHGK
jgi:hypothetical protein